MPGVAVLDEKGEVEEVLDGLREGVGVEEDAEERHVAQQTQRERGDEEDASQGRGWW